MQLQNMNAENGKPLSTLLTIVIPVRVDSEERKANLQAVLRQLQPLRCRTIVLEADTTSRLEDLEWGQAEHVFVLDEAPSFHRTRYINRLMDMADTDIVGVWDTDVLADLVQIAGAVGLIQSGCTIAYPYDGRFVMLPEQTTIAEREHPDLESLRARKLISFLGRKWCGGAYIVSRTRYRLCGGENERFTSWGPEDAERLRRVEILGHRAAWCEGGELFHLHHPRTKSSCFQTEADAVRMRGELVRVCNMDKEEMEAYVAGAEWNSKRQTTK